MNDFHTEMGQEASDEFGVGELNGAFKVGAEWARKELIKENKILWEKIYKYEELVGSLFMNPDGEASFQGSQGDLDYFNKTIEAIGSL